MDDATEHFRVDLAGHYDFEKEVHAAIDRFIVDLPVESSGFLRAGEYCLPTDGRLMLLITDAQICLMA